MREFKVGDRVVVNTIRHGRHQYGDRGRITRTSRVFGGELPIEVKFDPGCHSGRNSYAPEDLRFEILSAFETDLVDYIKHEMKELGL